MKKSIPYILGSLLVVAMAILFITGNNKKEKTLDERITLSRKDKIPYGTYVAFNELTHLFPKANIYTSRREPGYWDSLSNYDADQAVIIITGQFNADESEMKTLISFIEKGNDVFVSARTLSYATTQAMGIRVNTYEFSDYYDSDEIKDSLSILLRNPPFETKKAYAYKGKKLDASFTNIDKDDIEILGEDNLGRPDFIRLRAGKGNFYVHLAPLAFSNYFLLHKNNIDYYEKALSVIESDVTKIVWDEYYLNKKFLNENNDNKKGWFSVLSRYPALKAALLTAIFTLLLYVLLEMRRKQRYIPVVAKPRNDSMDFVKTIGRLYFDKGDHKNLCRKMSSYFLEHVRNKYKIPTGTLDDSFVKVLQYKSGAEEHEVREIISFIKYVEDAPGITHQQLSHFHKQLENFYHKA